MRYLWYSMYAFVTALAIYSLFFRERPAPNPGPSPVVFESPAFIPEAPAGDVQIALILDTSSSMDGLIEQARTQLWEIVGELQTDDKDKPRAVTVALYQYGNSRLDQSTGFIEKLSDLTTELDGVSVKLHALSTSGGKEHAPEAIARACRELDWSDDDSVEKVIVIAGNEGFSQGKTRAEEAMTEAANKGIRVIPIFCANGGATSTGLSSWKRAAQLANTDLDTIDPDKVIAKVETPYDAEIVKKYKELEATQLTYGDAAFRQEVASFKSSANSYAQNKPMALQADRAVTQARQVKRGDLVNDYGTAVNLERLDPSSLPSELQGLSKEAQVKEIQERKVRRQKIEGEIQSLSGKRKGYMNVLPTYQAGDAGSAAPAPTLGSSVRSKLRGNN